MRGEREKGVRGEREKGVRREGRICERGIGVEDCK